MYGFVYYTGSVPVVHVAAAQRDHPIPLSASLSQDVAFGHNIGM